MSKLKESAGQRRLRLSPCHGGGNGGSHGGGEGFRNSMNRPLYLSL